MGEPKNPKQFVAQGALLSPWPTRPAANSNGKGNTIVWFFSDEMELRVCKEDRSRGWEWRREEWMVGVEEGGVEEGGGRGQ